MLITAIVIAIAAVGFMACLVRLRGGASTDPFENWWPAFEREFRAYAVHHTHHNHTTNREE
jgi:hypothetical protein